MKKYEYEITSHTAEEFKQLVYFCTEEGECNLDEVPSDQLRVMVEILNHRGAKGWELVQISFGMDGIIAFWKREI